MKTSVELEKDKVALAKQLGNISTLRELLDLALDAYIAQSRRFSIGEMLGTGFFKGNLKKMRATRVYSRR